MSPAQLSLLSLVRTAGGSIDIKQTRPGCYGTPASVLRALQRKGYIRVTRLGGGVFRVQEVARG